MLLKYSHVILSGPFLIIKIQVTDSPLYYTFCIFWYLLSPVFFFIQFFLKPLRPNFVWICHCFPKCQSLFHSGKIDSFLTNSKSFSLLVSIYFPEQLLLVLHSPWHSITLLLLTICQRHFAGDTFFSLVKF